MATHDLGTVGFTIENTGGQKSIAELKQLADAGLNVYRSNNKVSQSEAKLAQYFASVNSQIVSVNRNMQNHNRYLFQASNGMNRMGVAAQQTGYQVSDFIVQVQGGTNPLVAFSQQATQLAGLLYLLPPALQAGTYSLFGFKIALSTVFAGATILIPLVSMLAMAFFNSKETTDKGSEAVNRYANTLTNLKSSLVETANALEAVRRGVVLDDLFEAQLALEAVRAEFISLTTTEGIADSDPWGLATRLAELTKLRAELEKSIEDLARVREEEQRLEIATKRRANEVRNIYRQQKIDADAQLKSQEEMNKKITLGKNLFHGLAGETQSVSIYLSDALRSALGLASVNFSNVKTVADYLAVYQGQMGRGLPSTGKPAFTYPLNADNRFGPSFERGGRGPIPAGVVKPTLEDLLGGSGGGTAGSAGAAPRDIIGDFQKQLDLEKELLGTSEAYQKVRQALGEEFKTTSPVVIAGLVQQATETQRLIDLDNQRKEIMDTVKSSMEDAFMSMVDGTKSAKEAFKSMAAEIIKELYRILVVKQLVNSIAGALMPAAAPAGPVAPLPRPPGLATGGSMMANRAYMVGENGPELVIPRHSGSVVNANQTANAMGGSGNFTQNLSINVTGSDATMVRTEVAKMIPQITNATKAAVIDARLRGGQMKQAFR